MGQVLERKDLVEALSRCRSGRKVVFTNGCFDLLHVGHVRYLQQARNLGDLLVVGLNTDVSVRRLKGPKRPVQSEGDRAEILAALNCVDFVTLFSEDSPVELIHEVRPEILVKGGDWPVKEIDGADYVRELGGTVHSIPFQQGHSTSGLIERLQDK